MSLTRQAIKTLLAAMLPPRLLFMRGPSWGRSLALTFDDGPDPELTPRVLDALEQHGIRATFFLVGSRAAKNPELIRRMISAGHDVGHHSYTHSEPDATSAAKLAAEVRQSRELLWQITGGAPTLFRPPKGRLSFRKMYDLWRQSQTIVLWNVDPRDYAMTSCGSLTDWCAGYKPAAGDVVLLHDDRPFATDAIPVLAARAASAGLTFRPVSHWLTRHSPKSVPLRTEGLAR